MNLNKQMLLSVALSLILTTSSTQAVADIYFAELEWSVYVRGEVQGFVNQLITGSSTFFYDTDGVAEFGDDEIVISPLRTFSMSPATFGVTTFDLTNTAAEIVFHNGELQAVSIGDGLHGDDRIRSIGGLDTNGQLYDDFAVRWFSSLPATQFGSFGIQVASEPGLVLVGGARKTFTATLVPEPSTAILATLGLTLLVLRRRR